MNLNFYFVRYILALRLDVETFVGPRRMGLGLLVSVQSDYIEVELAVPFVQVRMTRYSG